MVDSRRVENSAKSIEVLANRFLAPLNFPGDRFARGLEGSDTIFPKLKFNGVRRMVHRRILSKTLMNKQLRRNPTSQITLAPKQSQASYVRLPTVEAVAPRKHYTMRREEPMSWNQDPRPAYSVRKPYKRFAGDNVYRFGRK